MAVYRQSQFLLMTPFGPLLALMMSGVIAAAFGGPTWLVLPLAAVTAGVLGIHMTVRVEPDRVRISYPPLGWKTIPIDRIAAAEAVTYRPMAHYGGWGPFRWSIAGQPTAWTLWGNRGVMLTFTDGKRLLVGARDAEALAGAINTCREALSEAT